MTSLVPIAHIQSDFPAKFGIPRQSNVVEELCAAIVFEPEYRNPDALRGLEDFSHLWLIWGFSAVRQDAWTPTVRPPWLGGNARMGVFATRSPYRPNPIGLSSVRLRGIDLHTAHGPVIHIAGGDLMDGSPIYDIKPYLPFTDCHPDAVGGFAAEAPAPMLKTVIAPELLALLPADKHDALRAVLAHDPRPRYQHDPGRVYGMGFAGFEVKFSVDGDTLTVLEIEGTDGPGRL